MLVLSRKDGEAICIGEDIEITVCDIGKGRVRLGIRCPESVRILRAELSVADALHREWEPVAA
jgi:carbon storage regulator